MTWLAVAWKFLRGIPWQVWAVAALLVAAWYYGHLRYNAGEAACNAKWEAAQDEANRKSIAAELKRDKTAASTNEQAAGKAAEASASTRTETASAVERVANEARTIVVPANCPTTLPVGVRAEIRAAVARARAAGN